MASNHFPLPLRALTILLLSFTTTQSNAQTNLTNLTEPATTIGYSSTELYTTELYTTASSDSKGGDKTFEIEVEITVTLSTDNVTIPELTDIVKRLITELDDGLEVNKVELETDTSDDGEFTVTWKVVIIADSSKDAKAVEKTVTSEDFKSDLTTAIEENTEAEVTQIETEAKVITQETTTPQWLDPSTYVLFNWIIFGAAACGLCVSFLCICRCCWLCAHPNRLKKKKSQYQVGGPLFDNKSSNQKEAKAFQNDLFQAIEMNARSSYLKPVKSTSDKNLGGLKDEEVANAFDMNFDEIRPITQQSSTEEAVTVSEEKEDKTEVKQEKKKKEGDAKEEKKKKKKKKEEGTEDKGSELTKPLSEGISLPMVTTEKDAPDKDEENPPKAPEPPKDMTTMEDYDLL